MSELCPEHSLDQVGRILGSILDLASIKRLIVVDDDYSQNEIDLPRVIARAQADPRAFDKLIKGLADIESDELDLIATTVQAALQDKQVQEKAWAICTEGQQDAQIDEDTAGALDRIIEAIPSDYRVEFRKLSGSAWTAEAESILCNENAGNSLVLVDRDFAREDKGEDYGLHLISSILEKYDKGVYCALLSHTVNPEEELSRWEELANTFNIDKHRFVVVAKRRLAGDDPDTTGFVRLMRLAILCEPLKELRDLVSGHYAEAISKTGTALNSWSVFDFDEAVFGSSRAEGVWEGETLLRVMTTFTTLAARSLVLQDPEVRELIAHARKASSFTIPSQSHTVWQNVGTMALSYQRAEKYIAGEHLNSHHLPIEAGDVFDQDTPGAEFILLAQPCDLMVRQDGRRAYDDQHTRMVPLCQVKSCPPNGDDSGYLSYKLDCWYEDGRPGYVHFSQVHLVRLAILDLCVFQADGRAKFEKAASAPELLNEAWNNYFSKLTKTLAKENSNAKELIDHLIRSLKLPKNTLKMAKTKLAPMCSNTGKFRATLAEEGFTVNVRRVNRVAGPVTGDILRGLARYQSRTAFDRSVITSGLERQLSSYSGES